jgi:hypothetical protein
MLKKLDTSKPSPRSSQSKLSTEVVVVTPTIAKAWLDMNTRNRKPSSVIVGAYARDMKAGRWMLTADPIRFDTKGNLIDGQHRLLACIQSESHFPSLVAYGLPAEAQDFIDCGKRRSVADMLSLNGHHNTLILTSLLRWLVALKKGLPSSRTVSLTHTEAAELLQKHPRTHASVRQASGVLGVPASIVACIHYVGTNFLDKADRADAFVEVLKTGIPDYSGDPVHMLRERILKLRTTRDILRKDDIGPAGCHVWNLFAAKKKVQILRLPKDAIITGLDLRKL